MNNEDIKAVVTETIDQLLHGNLIKYSDLVIYERVSDMLREHYKKPDPVIAQALDQLKDHTYFKMLEMYYKDDMTLEEIANRCFVDISTVVRNKKSLCIKLFNLI